jgi:hypothetical protein
MKAREMGASSRITQWSVATNLFHIQLMVYRMRKRVVFTALTVLFFVLYFRYRTLQIPFNNSKVRQTNVVASTVFVVHPYIGVTNLKCGTIDGMRSMEIEHLLF